MRTNVADLAYEMAGERFSLDRFLTQLELLRQEV